MYVNTGYYSPVAMVRCNLIDLEVTANYIFKETLYLKRGQQVPSCIW